MSHLDKLKDDILSSLRGSKLKSKVPLVPLTPLKCSLRWNQGWNQKTGEDSYRTASAGGAGVEGRGIHTAWSLLPAHFP